MRPIAVHDEPDCVGTKGCSYPEPHRHGFDCDHTCVECAGVCHPNCPVQLEENE